MARFPTSFRDSDQSEQFPAHNVGSQLLPSDLNADLVETFLEDNILLKWS